MGIAKGAKFGQHLLPVERRPTTFARLEKLVEFAGVKLAHRFLLPQRIQARADQVVGGRISPVV